MSNILDPADPQALLRRIVGLEKRLRTILTALSGAQYAHDEGGNRTVASAGTFLNFTGQPIITLAVPDSGRVRVSWGFIGFNSANATATVRVSVALSGANVSAAAVPGACTSGDNIGAGTDPQSAPRSASRTKVYEGLTPGSTTFTLQGRISATGTHAIQDAWLLVEPMP